MSQIVNNDELKVVIYCRESRDDYMEHYERIETQRDLLLRHCEKKGYTNIVKVIMHNNFTGTNFDRLDEIRDMVKLKQVDLIVMKDSSRLGRNQLEALKFMTFLQDNDVEVEFEGKSYDPDFFPLEAWFNELRAKDDSKKIRTNIKEKMEQGDFLIREHFGYKKVDKNLIIDEGVSWVVELIFDLYKKGYGYRRIATILNGASDEVKMDKVPTPSEYKNNQNRPIASAWSSHHVVRILKNETYTGTLICGHTEKVSYKSKKTKRKKEEYWFKHENNHDAIISKETFDIVQEMIFKKKDCSPKAKVPALLTGFLKCGRCGSNLYIIRPGNRPPVYMCGKYFKEGKVKGDGYGCVSHRIMEDKLDKTIESHIYNMIENIDYRDYFNKNLCDIREQKKDSDNLLKQLEDNLKNIQKQYEQIYTDKLEEKIPEFIFIKKSKELDDKINLLEDKIKKEKNKISNIDNIDKDAQKFDIAVKNIIDNKLTKEGLSLLINKIIVFDKYEAKRDIIDLYNVDEPMFKELYENGGIVIDMKPDVQHVMSSRWMCQLVDTLKTFDIQGYFEGSRYFSKCY